METAHKIQLDQRGLLINGRRLPFWLALEPVEVHVDEMGISRVTLTLLAESVEVSPQLEVTEEDGDLLVEFPLYEAEPHT